MNAPDAVATLSVHKNESLLFFTLLQLAVIVIAGRLGEGLAKSCRQAPVVGAIIAGILLGPSLFGWLAPDPFNFVFHSSAPEPLQVLSGLGLVLVMFQIGLEFDFSHLTQKDNRRTVIVLAAAGLIVPFAIGLAFGYYSAPTLSPEANRLYSALFVATAFSITALPVLGRIMIELGITRTRLGVIAISAAAINDVVGWIMLALVTALSAATFDSGQFGVRVALVTAFILVSIYLVRPLLKRAVRLSNPREGRMSANLLAGILVVAFVAAMTTYQLGVFAIFGAFMMGVILFDERELVRAWRERMGGLVTVFFLPLFFTYTGLRTSIGGVGTLEAWGWCAVVVILATIAKFGAAYAAARYSRLNHVESAVLGYMMNTRGLMELVVINVGYDLGVISQQMFTMLVIMAIVSTVITTPALRHYLKLADWWAGRESNARPTD
ncbi:MAG TPA: cation:proton antiporter [Steroidobacteraceae bacterium]|nr:cation:proton antiporter [Steroidobacteraceae bacterium]